MVTPLTPGECDRYPFIILYQVIGLSLVEALLIVLFICNALLN